MLETVQHGSPVRLLIGGGIGSGKTLVAKRLAELGAHIVVADRVGHEVLGDEAFAAVAARWPETVAGGRIDRRALAGIVFADPRELRVLEEMTHPAIIQRIVAISAAEEGPVVVEVPVMLRLPGAWTRVFIDAEQELRIQRAGDRGISERNVRRRVATQASRAQWVAWADVIITNNGTVEALYQQVDDFWYGIRNAGYGARS